MRRCLFAVILALGATGAPGHAQAQDFVSAWIEQLRLDGYEDIEIERTWLGRIRIVAERGDIEREIILNRATGEVLRDYSEAEDGGYRLPLGWEVELDDDDDDDDEDDDDDDEGRDRLRTSKGGDDD